MPIVLLHDGHLENTCTNGVDSNPDTACHSQMQSCSRSRLITEYALSPNLKRVTRRLLLLEQNLSTLHEYHSSPRFQW
jgi:hypothetical protein